MANITAIIANRGFYYTPHIIKKISTENGIDSSFTKKKFCSIEADKFKPIIEGMQQVVEGEDGTGQNAVYVVQITNINEEDSNDQDLSFQRNSMNNQAASYANNASFNALKEAANVKDNRV